MFDSLRSSEPPPRLIATIHDVSPPALDEVRRLLQLLDALEVRPRVLKVIPNADGAHAVADATELVHLLQVEAAAGSEIVLHGYTHRASGPARGPLLTRLRARLFAGSAAELLSLNALEQAERIAAGQRSLAALGLQPRGFCAPGWLAPTGIRSLLRRLGFRYYVGLSTLDDLRTGRRQWTPWIGYLGADPWQERLIRLAGAVQGAAFGSAPVVKVFLHPRRSPKAPGFQSVIEVLARLVRQRQPTTFSQLLDL